MVSATQISKVGKIAAGLSTAQLDESIAKLNDARLLIIGKVIAHPTVRAIPSIRRLNDRLQTAAGTRIKVKAKLASRRSFPTQFATSTAGGEITRATVAKAMHLRKAPSAAAMHEYKIRLANLKAQANQGTGNGAGSAGSGGSGGSGGTIAVKAAQGTSAQGSGATGAQTSQILPGDGGGGGLNTARQCLNSVSGLGRYNPIRGSSENRGEYDRIIPGLGCNTIDRLPQDRGISGLSALELEAMSQTRCPMRGLGDGGGMDFGSILSDVADESTSDGSDILSVAVDDSGGASELTNAIDQYLNDTGGDVGVAIDQAAADAAAGGAGDLTSAIDNGLDTSAIDAAGTAPNDLATSPLNAANDGSGTGPMASATQSQSWFDANSGTIKDAFGQVIKAATQSQTAAAGATKGANPTGPTRAGGAITSPFVGPGGATTRTAGARTSSPGTKKLLPWLIGGGLLVAAAALG